jgi:hypothetical protein
MAHNFVTGDDRRSVAGIEAFAKEHIGEGYADSLVAEEDFAGSVRRWVIGFETKDVGSAGFGCDYALGHRASGEFSVRWNS